VEVNAVWATTTYMSKELLKKTIQISNKILKVPISLVIKEIQIKLHNLSLTRLIKKKYYV